MTHRSLLPVLFALVAAVPLPAQHRIDQQQSAGSALFSRGDWWTAQTFLTDASNISGGGALLENRGVSTATFFVKLWSGDPSVSGSTELASTQVSPDVGSLSSRFWVEGFWSPVDANSAQEYWLIIGGGPSNVNFVSSDNGDAYGFGRATTSASGDFSDPYTTTRPLDLVFRTYSTVPEPGTVTLLCAGLLALGIARRGRGA